MQKIKSQKGSVTLIVIVTMLFLITFLMATYVMISNKAQTSAEITAQIKEQYNNLEEGGSVNENSIGGNVIPIYTKEQLVQMGNGQEIYIEQENKYYTYAKNGYYILKNNIDVNEEKYTINNDGTITFNDNAEQWTPFTSAFTGTLDGLMHNIYGLYIENISTTSQYRGLFSILNKNATIKNMGIENSYISIYKYAGSFAGQNNGKIENCYNNGTILVTNNIAGGLVGINAGIISNSYNISNNVKGNNDNCGGICGSNSKTIENCYNMGNINGYQRTGGISGGNSATGKIILCYNKGEVRGRSIRTGGITAINSGIIEKCYNEGYVVGGGYSVGGIVAENDGTIKETCNLGTIRCGANATGGISGRNSSIITCCYNAGTMEYNGSTRGGIVGYNVSTTKTPTVSNCYNIGIMQGATPVGTIIGQNGATSTATNCYYLDTLTFNLIGSEEQGTTLNCSSKTDLEMKATDGSFIGLLNTNISPAIWKEDTNNINNGYPIFTWQEANFSN